MNFNSIINWILRFRIKNFFGLVLATTLLAFYVLTWFHMITSVASPPDEIPNFLTDGFFYVATASAGIASALAIAILGATPPEKSPKFEYMADPKGGQESTGTLTILYLFAWVAIGVSAVYYGMIYGVPDGHDTTAIGTAHQHLKVYGSTWFGMALSAVFVYFKLRPTSDPEEKLLSDVEKKLEDKINEGKIVFDPPAVLSARLRKELFRENEGQKISVPLQELILHLSEIVSTKIRISSLVRESTNFKESLQKHFRTFAGHPGGTAVDIGNEEVAREILSLIASDSEVSRLKIDEIIFDAKVSGETDRNLWNYDQGSKHKYNSDTLDEHADHIHFKVL